MGSFAKFAWIIQLIMATKPYGLPTKKKHLSVPVITKEVNRKKPLCWWGVDQKELPFKECWEKRRMWVMSDIVNVDGWRLDLRWFDFCRWGVGVLIVKRVCLRPGKLRVGNCWLSCFANDDLWHLDLSRSDFCRGSGVVMSVWTQAAILWLYVCWCCVG